MTHARPRTVAAIASGLAGCLLLAACSGGSSPGAATSPTAGASSGGSHAAAGATSAPAPAGGTSTGPGSAGSSGPPPPVAAVAAACSLITETDVTMAVGADPGHGAGGRQRGATGCTYGSYPKEVLTVNVLPTRGRSGYDRVRSDPRVTTAAGAHVTPLSGVGDQAFELSGAHVDAVYFTKGDAMIVIALTAPTAPTSGAALALARLAAGRL